MTRYIIIGAGAVGASLAAQFELTGIDYALVGRGAQIRHIIDHGLTYQRPSGTRQIRLKAFDTADVPALGPADVLLLTVKTQDVAFALDAWAWRPLGERGETVSQLPIVTFQNGLAAEAIALRSFPNVYGASILTPARYTETGKVVVGGHPQVAVVTIGRYPHGTDAIADRLAADLSRADYIAETTSDIRRWKAAKLTHNVRNVIELFQGPETLRGAISTEIVEEAKAVLAAAGYTLASPAERKVSIADWRIAENSGIEPGQQSTWQSFKRGASSEVDYLNGEIVLLGRLNGIATPYNQAAQELAGRAAQAGSFSSPLSIETLLARAELPSATLTTLPSNAA
ncbi:2-dehydropantoate 2-reductase N-terminal domain-containing protein [Rhizobium sp. RU36D]|uniref:ketopantoate reductase family protein n=1 Tax=Rhizobium sp. RU36D TaxID=1907415 RepID=UPI0009D83E3A|nr:2-dehydropantoate 2-reductase N-terminal domain-containing protein [Rhizobium sp. RU36D]SMD14656.1 2-dehydropantoate 2-reductase [Rhizobium sp. RU36D]